MRLIIGLGNIGKDYAKTRHNVGFMVLDQLVEHHKWEPFKEQKRFKALVSQATYRTPEGEQKLVLAKPTTLMNGSGEAVANLMHFYNLRIKDVWIVHDDLDIEFGKLRIRQGGGSAGHRGIHSIMGTLGSDQFVRFRVGIGSNRDLGMASEDYVLQRFSKEEEEVLPKIITSTAESVTYHCLDLEIFDHTRNLLE